MWEPMLNETYLYFFMGKLVEELMCCKDSMVFCTRAWNDPNHFDLIRSENIFDPIRKKRKTGQSISSIQVHIYCFPNIVLIFISHIPRRTTESNKNNKILPNFYRVALNLVGRVCFKK